MWDTKRKNVNMIDHSVQLNLSQAHETAHLGALTKVHGMRKMKHSEKIAFGSLSALFLACVGVMIWAEFFPFPGSVGDMWSFSPFDAMVSLGWPLLVVGIQLGILYFTLYDHKILLTPLHQRISIHLYTEGFLLRLM